MRFLILAVGAALALGACSGSETTEGTSNSLAGDNTAVEAGNMSELGPARNETAPAPETAAAAPAAGAAPSRTFLIGKWGDGGDCTLAIDFKADGTMDGPVERWELNGAELTMVGLPEKMHLSVIDEKTMESRLGGTGAPRRLTRC